MRHKLFKGATSWHKPAIVHDCFASSQPFLNKGATKKLPNLEGHLNANDEQLWLAQRHLHCRQGAKKVIFIACHSGKLKLTFTSPNIILTSPKNVVTSRLISRFFCNLNSLKTFTCPLGKFITEFTSPIAKSTSPGLSDTTFFACWLSLIGYTSVCENSCLPFW